MILNVEEELISYNKNFREIKNLKKKLGRLKSNVFIFCETIFLFNPKGKIKCCRKYKILKCSNLNLMLCKITMTLAHFVTSILLIEDVFQCSTFVVFDINSINTCDYIQLYSLRSFLSVFLW